jgi:hypothetical protein
MPRLARWASRARRKTPKPRPVSDPPTQPRARQPRRPRLPLARACPPAGCSAPRAGAARARAGALPEGHEQAVRSGSSGALRGARCGARAAAARRALLSARARACGARRAARSAQRRVVWCSKGLNSPARRGLAAASRRAATRAAAACLQGRAPRPAGRGARRRRATSGPKLSTPLASKCHTDAFRRRRAAGCAAPPAVQPWRLAPRDPSRRAARSAPGEGETGKMADATLRCLCDLRRSRLTLYRRVVPRPAAPSSPTGLRRTHARRLLATSRCVWRTGRPPRRHIGHLA